MLTWQLDRLFRSGPFCAVGTFVLPAVLAIVVATTSDVENVLGIVLLAAAIMFLGTVFGSVVMTALGALLFGVGTVVAEIEPWLVLCIACGLFTTLVLHDLAGAFRRAPYINRAIWTLALAVVVVVVGASAVAFSITYLVATLSVWKSIVVPFAIAAMGFGAKLAADTHAKSAKQLTAKRPSPDDSAKVQPPEGPTGR